MARLLRLLVCSLTLAVTIGWAQPVELAPGSQLAELPVGSITYQQVQVRSITTRSVIFLHRGGLASVRLRDLSPAWQQRFHYDPVVEATAEAAVAAVRPGASALAPTTPLLSVSRPVSPFEALLRQFGQPAKVQPEVDLRPQFFRLELGVKNQGRRPSCAIFAVVSALEFQNAEQTGQAVKFSEEYLSWAVRKTVQKLPPPADAKENPPASEDEDEGFTLSEVVAALRAYGIPPQARMPNTFGSKLGAIKDPPREIIREAQAHQRVFVHLVPGRDTLTRINNIVHALNAGLPVAIGMAWPHYRTLRNAYLHEQKPLAGSGHAVTLVGYRSTTGQIDDASFIFKNSWGASWGQGGYGIVTAKYLKNHLNDAVLLEIQSSVAQPTR